MRFTHFFFLLYFLIFLNCKDQKLHLNKIEGKQIAITDTIAEDTKIDSFIKPYRDHIQKDLDSVLAYSIDIYSKFDGEFNTAIGNFIADAIYTETNPVFKSRTGNDIDMVFLNIGSIRSIIPKGNVTARTIFEIMPFDNDIYVVAYLGDKIQGFVEDLSEGKQAHAISKLKIEINKNYELVNVSLNGSPIDPAKTYYLAISDYMYNSRPETFIPNEGVYPLDYQIRKILIDYVKKIDTIKPVIDDRFIQIN
tara:strand:- start:697 stop:1449 length:753 start_codon:yes stop_codon:yes gene_type:complete